MVSIASCPPLQKAQGRGTRSFETGRKNEQGWATRPLELGTEEVPGFAVLVVEAGAAVLFAAEQEAGAADGVERDDVPGILGNDVGGDEIDFSRAVGNGAAS